MCDHPERERAMTVVDDGIWCDPCLGPIVKALNEGGVPTVASCCGHGKRLGSIALADGRHVVVVPDELALQRLSAEPTPIIGAAWLGEERL